MLLEGLPPCGGDSQVPGENAAEEKLQDPRTEGGDGEQLDDFLAAYGFQDVHGGKKSPTGYEEMSCWTPL